MIDNICEYSTIILSGNLTVLLIISVTTDYWEYRTFNTTNLEMKLKPIVGITFDKPEDTGSYFAINYRVVFNSNSDFIRANGSEHTIYKPPIYASITNLVRLSDNCSTTVDSQNGPCYGNITIVFFEQYGNLYRDCDSLEERVRERLGFKQQRLGRCHMFMTINDDVHSEVFADIPAIVFLEWLAFIFAIIGIIAMCSSFACGLYATPSKDHKFTIVASFTALTTGISVTISIALFHGKCHLTHRRDILPHFYLPFKSFIDSSRETSYGWSFALAWICVVLAFVSCWTWLYKAQDLMPTPTIAALNIRPAPRDARTLNGYATAIETNDVCDDESSTML